MKCTATTLALTGLAAAVCASPAGAAPSATAAPYATTAGAFRDTPAFAVTYTGSSRTKTVYRGVPPNPGGKPDHNRATDSSKQQWALSFPAGLTIPTCGATPDPCAAVAGPTLATGITSASGRIDHTHVDGLYRQLDSAAHCSVKAKAVPRTELSAQITVAYDAPTDAFIVTALNPINDALIRLPTTCPNQPDSIDRIFDNYYTPGFNMGAGYGADRWFTAAPVSIPAAVWHSSSRIRLRPSLTPQGRPPANCADPAVDFPQRCRTSGGWSGVLTFTAK